MLVRGLSKTRQVEMDRVLVVEAMNEKKNDNERQGVSSGNECTGSVKEYRGPYANPP
jgi:hypothetical protein